MPALYCIATPIGNLEDITLRALRILREVDMVMAEDTRVTAKLLQRYELKKKLLPLTDHNLGRQWRVVRELLEQGGSAAYVTDAGTPGVSDPGAQLVRLAREQLPHIPVMTVPGPSALTAAISIAGENLDEFLFLGFLPHKKGRVTLLREIRESRRPVIVYESVHRMRRLLSELEGLDKQVIVCREMTKKFEAVYRGAPAEVLGRLDPGQLKGEFVVIIAEQ